MSQKDFKLYLLPAAVDNWVSPIKDVHPVQLSGKRVGKIGAAVSLRAYEVYEHIHGPQEEIITGACRGGFSAGELIAFLYAHSFPQAEWRDRANEAFRLMEL